MLTVHCVTHDFFFFFCKLSCVVHLRLYFPYFKTSQGPDFFLLCPDTEKQGIQEGVLTFSHDCVCVYIYVYYICFLISNYIDFSEQDFYFGLVV